MMALRRLKPGDADELLRDTHGAGSRRRNIDVASYAIPYTEIVQRAERVGG
jgi:hypothetical protein